jgi:uncharacterized protein (TIGR02147 family)
MNIYQYTDYRKFLKDSFSALKEKKRNLSIREILRRIGCASPSYYKEVVIDAKKNMSALMARKFADFLKLDSDQTAFFLTLVEYNQAGTESEKIRHYEELLRHRSQTESDNHFLELGEYQYLSSWELPAIREFLHFYKGFKNSGTEERQQFADFFLPRITGEKIDNAIRTLESLGFITKDSEGNYHKTGQNIRSLKKTPAAYVTLCQNMKHALDIINRTSPETRIFKNVVISVSSTAYEIIEKKVQEFCKEILDIVSNDTEPEERLYSLGLQLFPITKPMKEPK